MTLRKKYIYPNKLSIIRFFLDAEKVRKNPIPIHEKYFNALGDTFSVRIGFTRHLILSRDNDVAKHILQKSHRNYYKSNLQTVYLSKYLGKGLLTSDGDFWLKQRRLIQPAFHKQKMNALVGNMNQIITLELDDLIEENPVDIFPIMSQLAYLVVAKSLFHLSISDEKLFRMKFIIDEVQNFLIKEIRLPHKAWWFTISGQVKKNIKLSLENNAIIHEIVEKRLTSNQETNDLLQMLLDTRYEDTGEGMSVTQLIDEIKILFTAGYETTANALTFTLYLLANHPDIQEKVYQEIITVASETQDLVEQLQKLTYTNAVLNESMRLYPPAWITDRQNIVDDTIGSYYVKKGTLIGVSFYELHRNPKYWEKPAIFDPERFLGERKKHSMQYFYPFGAGPRMCIGIGFAVYEMTITLSTILKKYLIKPFSGPVQFNPLVTLKPVGVEVIFSKR